MASYRILLVDDDPDTLAVMSSALRSKYETVEAVDGYDAMRKIDDFQPDAAVIDAVMPGMDGYELCRAIRTHDACRAIPIVFLSAYGSKENIRKGYASGANLFLTKPIDPLRVLKNVDFTIQHEKNEVRRKRYTTEELAERAKSGRYDKPARPSPPPPPKPEPARAAGTEATSKPREAAPPPPPPKPEPVIGRAAPEEVEYEEVEEVTYVDADEVGEDEEGVEYEYVEEYVDDEEETPADEPVAPQASVLVPRMLIVDNDDDTRELMEVTLGERYEIVTARDGIQAIDCIVQYQPDLILLDIMMPRMNGYQMLQSIRRNPAYKNLPVIVVSAKATKRDQAYVERLGSNDFLPKPFSVEELLKRVEAQIAGPNFVVHEKRIPINEIIELEYLKAKNKMDVDDQKDRQSKLAGLQEILDQIPDRDPRD